MKTILKFIHRLKKEKFINSVRWFFFTLSIIGTLVLIYDIGIRQSFKILETLYWIYLVVIYSGFVFIVFSYLFKKSRPGKKAWLIDGILLILFGSLISNLSGWFEIGFLEKRIWLNAVLIVIFFRSLAAIRLNYSKRYLNPAQLFITSFISIILLGTLLLLLPNATQNGISFLNALFTSTSAVCVTGLIVVDTGAYFTLFGQTIILFLIQAGGIGIMTFTSYFGYFFKGGASFQNRLMMQDMNNSDKIAEVFRTLKKIILITIIIEIVGAAIIYTSIEAKMPTPPGGSMFFSVFHSISGFCNAGFSTLANSFYDGGYRFNYLLHFTIAVLFIIGGLGFPIVFNTLTYLRHITVNRIFRKKSIYVPWIIGINTRIVVITTLCLLGAGTIIFYIFEYNNTLSEHGTFGKIITAFFGAATPRTAGFNTVDISSLHFSTIIIILVLMWIGASPGSTGGGIKTSTFAIAILNFLSIAKGKDRIEVFNREISPISTRRAFAILSLSIIVIGISILLLAYFDGDKGLLPIAFESFSAYSTVGLSLGITSSLSNAGKLVIIFTMFIGRVSMLAILVAFMRRIVNLKYKFPTEDVLIN